MRHVILLVFLLLVPELFADLKSYVEKPDDSYTYDVVKDETSGTVRTRMIHMTSQTWDEKPWKHWMYLATPKVIQHPEKAILIIVGGSNKTEIPKLPNEIRIIAGAVEQLGVPVAIVSQIPNQPLFGNLKEDDIIAHTMTLFLESNDFEDIVLLPMVKSAVKAMDCVAELSAQDGNPIEAFVVSGASKRGWTTYLAAAVDDRVIAAAPMVIDMLNIPVQMEKQKKAYGKGLSPKIEPYTSRDVLSQLDSDQGRALLNIVDPFAYRHLLAMPKLLLLGTNDPFWTVNAANVYYDQLPGQTYLHYVANAGHGLNLSALPALLNFFKACVQDQPLAKFHWLLNNDGSTTIDQHEGARLTLWQAHSDTMDFREAKWQSRSIQEVSPLQMKLPAPDHGYLAYYIQASYSGISGMPPYSLTSQISVLKSRSATHEAETIH